MSKWISGAIGAALLASFGCSSGANKCVTGQSIACAGTGGCSGSQVCNADGTYGACQCASTDAGTGTDAGQDAGSSDAGVSDAGGWTPHQMGGLVLWLNNGTVVLDGGVVWRWPDSSDAGNDFVPGGSSPLLVDFGAINGRDAVRFVSAPGNGMSNAPSTPGFQWGTAGLLVEVVVKPGACSTPCPLWTGTDGVHPGAAVLLDVVADGGSGLVANASFGGLQNGPSSGTFAGGQAHVLGIRRTAPDAGEVRVDGLPLAATIQPADLSFSESGNLGVYDNRFNGTTWFLDGDIAEVVAASAPSDADVAQLDAYLKAKYGL